MKTGSASTAAGPAPIVVCVGPESWLRDEAVRRLTEQCIAPGAAAMDTVSVLADEAEPGAIVDAARTPPFLSPRRLVLVRGPLPTDEEVLGWLIRYAQQPAPSACLVVEFEESPAPSVQAALKGVSQLVECASLTGGRLVAWIRHRLQQTARKTITPAAVETLIARAGHELATLAQLLEQLALAIGDRPEVTEDDVAGLIGWSAEERVFAIVDALIARDRATALRVTRRLLEEEGVSPEELLGALSKHLRRIWRVAYAIEHGASSQAAMQQAGVHWRAQASIARLVGRTRSAALTPALEALLEVDRQLKTGSATPAALLEPCVWELAGRQAAAV